MSPSDASLAARERIVHSPLADRLHADWPYVHVHHVEVVPGSCGRRARAVVQLAGLSPADVQVDLIPAGAAGADSSSCGDARRMWSTQSYENGSFVFEQTLPPLEVDVSRDWLVRILADEALHERPVQHTFRVARETR